MEYSSTIPRGEITSKRLCKDPSRVAAVSREYYFLAHYCFYLSMMFMYWSHHSLTTEKLRSVSLMTNITFSQFDDKITKVDQQGLDKITQPSGLPDIKDHYHQRA